MANPVEKATTFLSEVAAEMKKVTWPNGKQTAASTLVVVVFSLVVALYLFGVDFVVQFLVGLITGR